MVRSSSLTLEQIADPGHLAAALDRAARGCRSSVAVARFLANAGVELAGLRRELLSGTPRVGEVTRFQIFDPKPRLVQAPVFRERVLQHALMAHVGPVLDRTLVADTFACRVGKGTLAAVRRAQHHSRRFPWYGQLDIRHYFASIEHAVLLKQLGRLFRDARVRGLLERIVRAGSPTARGLPIGSLCSQHFANF
ncbi:MAG: RNA-dependent DNA polymerase, partial [Planctomycetaceae bacterium]